MGRERDYLRLSKPEAPAVARKTNFQSTGAESDVFREPYSHPMDGNRVPRTIRTGGDALMLQQLHGNRAVTQRIQAQRKTGSPVVTATKTPTHNVVAREVTNEQKLAKLDRKIFFLQGVVNALMAGHQIVMLPLTIIDAIVSVFRKNPNKTDRKWSWKNIKAHILGFGAGLTGFFSGINVFRGTKLAIGPKLGHFRPFSMENMPWNLFKWLARPFNFWLRNLQRKRLDLQKAMTKDTKIKGNLD